MRTYDPVRLLRPGEVPRYNSEFPNAWIASPCNTSSDYEKKCPLVNICTGRPASPKNAYPEPNWSSPDCVNGLSYLAGKPMYARFTTARGGCPAGYFITAGGGSLQKLRISGIPGDGRVCYCQTDGSCQAGGVLGGTSSLSAPSRTVKDGVGGPRARQLSDAEFRVYLGERPPPPIVQPCCTRRSGQKTCCPNCFVQPCGRRGCGGGTGFICSADFYG